jgi:hypothetical protein
MNIFIDICKTLFGCLIFVASTAPLLVFPVFAGMCIYLGKSRANNGFFGLAAFFGIMTLVFVFLNPITGTVIGALIENHELKEQRRMYIGLPPERVIAALGQPNYISTNDESLYIRYNATSPWFSWFKSDTVILSESNVVKWIILDD